MFNAEKIVQKIADGVQEGENARRAAHQFNNAVQTAGNAAVHNTPEHIGQWGEVTEGAMHAGHVVPVPVPVLYPVPVEVPVYYHVSHLVPVPVTLVQDQMGNVFYTPVRTAEMSYHPQASNRILEDLEDEDYEPPLTRRRFLPEPVSESASESEDYRRSPVSVADQASSSEIQTAAAASAEGWPSLQDAAHSGPRTSQQSNSPSSNAGTANTLASTSGSSWAKVAASTDDNVTFDSNGLQVSTTEIIVKLPKTDTGKAPEVIPAETTYRMPADARRADDDRVERERSVTPVEIPEASTSAEKLTKSQQKKARKKKALAKKNAAQGEAQQLEKAPSQQSASSSNFFAALNRKEPVASGKKTQAFVPPPERPVTPVEIREASTSAKKMTNAERKKAQDKAQAKARKQARAAQQDQNLQFKKDQDQHKQALETRRKWAKRLARDQDTGFVISQRLSPAEVKELNEAMHAQRASFEGSAEDQGTGLVVSQRPSPQEFNKLDEIMHAQRVKFEGEGWNKVELGALQAANGRSYKDIIPLKMDANNVSLRNKEIDIGGLDVDMRSYLAEIDANDNVSRRAYEAMLALIDKRSVLQMRRSQNLATGRTEKEVSDYFETLKNILAEENDRSAAGSSAVSQKPVGGTQSRALAEKGKNNIDAYITQAIIQSKEDDGNSAFTSILQRYVGIMMGYKAIIEREGNILSSDQVDLLDKLLFLDRLFYTYSRNNIVNGFHDQETIQHLYVRVQEKFSAFQLSFNRE